MSVCLCVHVTVYAVVEAGFNIMYFPVEKGGWGICFKRYLLVRPRLRKISLRTQCQISLSKN